jgi:hypothetical protein
VTRQQRQQLPRCQKLDGSTLSIVPDYTEAGAYKEANCVTITDGERTAVYVPHEPGLNAVHVRHKAFTIVYVSGLLMGAMIMLASMLVLGFMRSQ